MTGPIIILSVAIAVLAVAVWLACRAVLIVSRRIDRLEQRWSQPVSVGWRPRPRRVPYSDRG